MEVIKDAGTGLEIYRPFDFNKVSFAASIVTELEPTQYFRDRPLFFGYINPVFHEAIELSRKGAEAYQGFDIPEINSYLNKLKTIDESLAIYKEEAAIIEEELRNLPYIEDNNPDIPVPTPDENNQTVEIKDADGNIIKTIDIDMNQRAQKEIDSNGTTQSITILDRIPEGYSDDNFPREADEVSIITLPDSMIQDKLWVAKEHIPKLTYEMKDAQDVFLDAVNEFVDVSPEVPTNELAKEYTDKLHEPLDVWYGIPLINLSPRGTPAKDSIILHVNTKKNWTLDLTNVAGVGFDKFEIRIDKTIPPETKFTAGVYVMYNTITIFLQLEGDDTLYEKSIPVNQLPSMELTSFGGDNSRYKTLCGMVWDIFHWNKPYPGNTNPRPPYPFNPPDGWVYPGTPPPKEGLPGGEAGLPGGETGLPGGETGLPGGDGSFSSETIIPRGKWLSPIGNYRKPAWNGGEWFDIGNLGFIKDGYVDRFFCRYNLQDTDFTIMWYQYQLGYPTGIKTLLADNIHSNYIRYNYDTFQLMVDFNNVHHTEYITLPEFLWSQFSIRYDQTSHDLKIGFRDFAWDRYEEISINIGPDLTFELMSLWGRFDRDQNIYIEKQEGIFGYIVVTPSYTNDDILQEWYVDHKEAILPYDPQYMLLEENVIKPGEIKGFTASQNRIGEVRLSWDEGLVGYPAPNIELFEDGVKVQKNIENGYIREVPAGEYEYYIVASNSAGESQSEVVIGISKET